MVVIFQFLEFLGHMERLNSEKLSISRLLIGMSFDMGMAIVFFYAVDFEVWESSAK
jgi:hypothetical protein